MGWKLITGKKENQGKYQVFSSIIDSPITEWLTRNQIIEYLDGYYQHEAHLKLIEQYFSFPFHWSRSPGQAIIENREGYESFYTWLQSTLSQENYDELVKEKYQEIMEQIRKSVAYEVQVDGQAG
jgi:hypothetical protein